MCACVCLVIVNIRLLRAVAVLHERTHHYSEMILFFHVVIIVTLVTKRRERTNSFPFKFHQSVSLFPPCQHWQCIGMFWKCRRVIREKGGGIKYPYRFNCPRSKVKKLKEPNKRGNSSPRLWSGLCHLCCLACSPWAIQGLVWNLFCEAPAGLFGCDLKESILVH